MRRLEPEIDFAPGGLLGFSAYSLEGALINLGTWGVPCFGHSHVAILADHPLLNELLVWESSSRSRLPCLLQERDVSGVQAHRIEEWIAADRGRYWYYPLGVPLFGSQPRDLTDWLDHEIGRQYDSIGAFRARDFTCIERWLGRENLETLFCSELVAAAWRQIGVWHTGNASRWSPNRLIRTALEVGILRPGRRVRCRGGKLWIDTEGPR